MENNGSFLICIIRMNKSNGVKFEEAIRNINCFKIWKLNLGNGYNHRPFLFCNFALKLIPTQNLVLLHHTRVTCTIHLNLLQIFTFPDHTFFNILQLITELHLIVCNYF